MTYSKYRAKRTELDGRSFASKLEASVYQVLKLLIRAGEITEIKCQVQVELTRARVIYKPDFQCTRPDGSIYFVESKGHETSDWRIKRKLWQYYGPGELQIWKGNASKPFMYEVIHPKA
jgi:hypothetical protein